MKKYKKLLILLLAGVMCFSSVACGKKENAETQDEAVETKPKVKDLQNNMFYVKNGDNYNPVLLGDAAFIEDNENRIARDLDVKRVMSFNIQEESQIPTLYKDDQLILVTNQTVPTFKFERFKDNGYSIGIYNLELDQSNKAQFLTAKSFMNKKSQFYQEMGKGVKEKRIPQFKAFTIDKVGGRSISVKNITECGSINGLKANETANADVYVGTEHYVIPTNADTHIFSAMELYETTEYNLLPDGFAQVIIPDYFLSGYYYICGMGMFKYVNNNRSEGIANIDFSVPYFYKDDNGNQITKEEYEKLHGIVAETKKDKHDYEFVYNLDTSQKTLSMEIFYSLKDNEDTINASATITSPLGQKTPFNETEEDGKKVLKVSIDGAMSGNWIIDVFNLGERKFDIKSNIESGNADSFIQSGTSNASFTIYTDGISGPAIAKVQWENVSRAANITITDPAGTEYKETEHKDLLKVDKYGEKGMLFNNAATGNWKIDITGEDLGRCWFRIEPYDGETNIVDTLEQPTAPNNETPAETDATK